jgi:hypothetical protein
LSFSSSSFDFVSTRSSSSSTDHIRTGQESVCSLLQIWGMDIMLLIHGPCGFYVVRYFQNLSRILAHMLPISSMWSNHRDLFGKCLQNLQTLLFSLLSSIFSPSPSWISTTLMPSETIVLYPWVALRDNFIPWSLETVSFPIL